MRKPCLGCGLLLTSGSRCASCKATKERARDAQRGTPAQRGYTAEWKRYSRQAIAHYRAIHGDTCPGWAVPPHPTSDWVTDHDLGPMCRGCNSRKAATHDKARAAHK